MTTSRAERFKYLRERSRYLGQLTQLVGREVTEAELISLEESRAILAACKSVVREPTSRSHLSFEEKNSERFRALVERLCALNPSDVYVWMLASNACGLLRAGPLPSLNWSFRFDINPDGIIMLFTTDCADEMMLDFSREEDGREELELHLSGTHWGRVSEP